MSGFRKTHPKKVKGDFQQLLADIYHERVKLSSVAFHEAVIEVLERERDLPPSKRRYQEMDYERRIEFQRTKITHRVLRELLRA
jgi:Mg-chelatase subunit ChlD